MEGSFECTLLHLLPTQKHPTCKGHTKKLRIETKSSYYIQKTSQGNVTVFCYLKKKHTFSFRTNAGKIAESNKNEKCDETNLHPCFQETEL
jgi:hypothetical protein